MELEQIPGADGLVGWTRRVPKFKGANNLWLQASFLKPSYVRAETLGEHSCRATWKMLQKIPIVLNWTFRWKSPPPPLDRWMVLIPDRSRSLAPSHPNNRFSRFHACTHTLFSLYSRAGLAWCPDSERIDSARSHVSQDSKCRGPNKQHLQRAAKSKLLNARIWTRNCLVSLERSLSSRTANARWNYKLLVSVWSGSLVDDTDRIVAANMHQKPLRGWDGNRILRTVTQPDPIYI